jgi:PAS domain S-box-containing protein
MSSSILKNVIHPKAQPAPLEKKAGEEAPANRIVSTSSFASGTSHDTAGSETEDMEMVLGALVENAPVAMAMFDKAMRYMLANRQWLTEFGLRQVQPLEGRSQYEIFPGLHPGWRQVYDRALQGHIVRSEHDASNAPDGSRLVYRWEVRPWRKKRDASVGGLMVTCEKFSATHSATDEEGAPDPPESREPISTLPKIPPLLECAQPMLMLNAQGVIQRANVTAARLTLDRGIQEGTTCFWEVWSDGRDSASLRQQLLATLADLSANPGKHAAFITTRPELSADPTSPSRWLVSILNEKHMGEAAPLFLLMGLPTQVAEKNTQVTVQVPQMAPVVLPPQPDLALEATVKHLEEELRRAKQELRTLGEAQQAFSRRETRLRSYLEGVPCGIFVLDERGAPLFQNERLAQLLGRPFAQEQTVEEWLSHACHTDEHRAQVALVWRESVWRRQLTRTLSLATADGLLKELEFHPATLPGGGLLVSIQDVTENTRHEEQLRSMEAKLRTLLSGSPVAVVLTDKTGVIFEVNQNAEKLLGQVKAELRRYPLDAWLDPDSATARRDALRQLGKSGHQAEALGVRVKRADGTFSNAILHLSTVTDAQGEMHCTVHFLQEAMPTAAVSEAEIAAPPQAASSLPDLTTTQQSTELLLTTDANGRVRTWTAHARRIFDVEEPSAVGRPLHQFFRPSDATGFFADLALQTAHPQQFVVRPFFGGNGIRGEVAISARMLEEGGCEIMTQITERVAMAAPAPAAPPSAPLLTAAVPQAFKVVSASSQRWPVADLEREKLLLTETHHRIKNHLQIISSLLNMQINGVSDQDARDALRSSQNRVRAIAALHQHLYLLALGKGDTFSDFTLSLVAHLRECYEVTAEQISVRLEIQEGPVLPEWLMPLALTLNEALSNSFEHAFPHGRQGQIVAILSYTEESGELTVRDDGVGLPAEFHPGEGGGLGLKILAVFADQMRGQLFVQGSPDRGTEIRLRFPLVVNEA